MSLNNIQLKSYCYYATRSSVGGGCLSDLGGNNVVHV